MGWIQKTREDNLTTRCETEKVGLKNDLESQVRDLKAQIAEMQKKLLEPSKGKWVIQIPQKCVDNNKFTAWSSVSPADMSALTTTDRMGKSSPFQIPDD
jgi:hypothetical protein